MTPTSPTARPRLLAGLLVAGLALAGCGTSAPEPSASTSAQSAGYPVTVSSCGRDQTFDSAPSRVVLGNYRSLETLDALGVGDAVTGYLLGPDDHVLHVRRLEG